MIDPERTIAAQATAAGQGAIAVIRMSGPGCMDILKQCTPAAFTERLRPRRATLVCIRDAEGAAIDQALVTWFPAPASYTGEDTAEISCHGGMLVTDRLLKRLYQCGASQRNRENTKRAFLNGRMDLTQAEAVMDVISAGSDLALKAAQTQLDGGIGAQVDELKDNLVHVLAHIEAYIDFPDEDISRTPPPIFWRASGAWRKNWPPSQNCRRRTPAAGRHPHGDRRTAQCGKIQPVEYPAGI
ncbi:MAG: hypothetical protein ACLT38_02550 [Akkermansia sp.]